MLLEDGNHIEFRFSPKIYKKGDNHFIKHEEPKKSVLESFMKTDRWYGFLDYCFNDLRPYVLPYYTPEMYFLDDITQVIENNEGMMEIVITGILKKREYSYVKNKYDSCTALNKTWTDDTTTKFKARHFRSQVKDAFYKSTMEGEINIPDIGLLQLGQDTPMKLLKLMK